MVTKLSLFPERVKFVKPDFTLTSEGYRALQSVFDRIGGALGNFDFTSLALSGNALIGGTLQLSNGTAAAPSLFWGSNTSTGFYRIAANNVGYSVEGVNILSILSTGLTINGTTTSTSFVGAGTGLTGTAPSLTAGNVTTNANLTGPITSVGNATAVASQTGTGSTFVMDTAPTLVTPDIGVATGASLATSGTLTGSNLSGTNTGDQTITLTGDVTGSGTGSFTATLSNTTVTPGVYTNTDITVDAKGRITAAANGAGGGPASSLAGGVAGRIPYQSAPSTTAFSSYLNWDELNATLLLGSSGPVSGTISTVNASSFGVPNVNIRTGVSSGTANGGSVLINAGSNSGTGSTGEITLTGGISSSAVAAGNVAIGGGTNSSTGPGGAVSISAGPSGGSTAGSNTTVQGGGSNSGTAGALLLLGGASSSGSGGIVTIRTTPNTAANMTERVRVNAVGEVLVGTGTSSSLGRLQTEVSTADIADFRSTLAGQANFRIRTTGSSGVFAYFQNSTSGTTTTDGLRIGIDSTNATIRCFENLPLQFWTNNTVRLTIDAAGDAAFSNFVNAAAFQVEDPNVLTRPAISARFNSANNRIGFNIAHSNGFGYLSYNANPKIGSDTATYDLTDEAIQLRLSNGEYTFNSAPSGTAGTDITWTTIATMTIGEGLRVPTVGTGLRVAEGSNAKQGTATLVAGVTVVANTSVTTNSRIFLTSQVDGGVPGFLRVSARVAATSFTITSSSVADTSTVAYEIFEPA